MDDSYRIGNHTVADRRNSSSDYQDSRNTNFALPSFATPYDASSPSANASAPPISNISYHRIHQQFGSGISRYQEPSTINMNVNNNGHNNYNRNHNSSSSTTHCFATASNDNSYSRANRLLSRIPKSYQAARGGSGYIVSDTRYNPLKTYEAVIKGRIDTSLVNHVNTQNNIKLLPISCDEWKLLDNVTANPYNSCFSWYYGDQEHTEKGNTETLQSALLGMIG